MFFAPFPCREGGWGVRFLTRAPKYYFTLTSEPRIRNLGQLMSEIKQWGRKRHWLISAGLVLAVALIILLLRLVTDIGVERQPGERFVVVRVIDGDTVELMGGDRLRLLGIDTPEKGERFHDQAAALLGRLALGKKARIEYADNRRDRYGRMLGFLYVDDTLFANRTILDSGLGCLYLFHEQDLQRAQFKELLEAQRTALEKQLGLWGLPQRTEKYYLTVKDSYRFHRPDCKMVKGVGTDHIRIIRTRNEALNEGLSPCRTCHP